MNPRRLLQIACAVLALLFSWGVAESFSRGVAGEREQFIWAAIFSVSALWHVGVATGWIVPEDEEDY